MHFLSHNIVLEICCSINIYQINGGMSGTNAYLSSERLKEGKY